MTPDQNSSPDPDNLREIKDKVIERSGEASSKISFLVRVTNLGLLGAIWTVFTGIQNPSKLNNDVFRAITTKDLLLLSICSIVFALLCEFMQYYSCYKKEQKVIWLIESGQHDGNGIYDRDEFWYRWQRNWFSLKIGFTIFNSILVIFSLATVWF